MKANNIPQLYDVSMSRGDWFGKDKDGFCYMKKQGSSQWKPTGFRKVDGLTYYEGKRVVESSGGWMYESQ